MLTVSARPSALWSVSAPDNVVPGTDDGEHCSSADSRHSETSVNDNEAGAGITGVGVKRTKSSSLFIDIPQQYLL